jgi:uncharacterized membrane protein YuzA (DUF378 family)
MDRLSNSTKALIAIALVGAINWGLVGIFNFNLVGAIFGGGSHIEASTLSRIIYAFVGLCGVAAAAMVPWGAKLSVGQPGRIGDRTEVRP